MEQFDIVKQMLLLQKRLNDETNGKGWEDGYTSFGKLINWKRCVYMECAELIDSFAWKHWKDVDKAPNLENIKMEVVDIWHFILSMILENGYTKNTSIDEMANSVLSTAGFSSFCLEPYSIKEYSIYEVINDTEHIIHKCSSPMVEIHDLLTSFFRLALKCEVNLAVLFELYIAKNVLNKFRQDNGYKDGKYIKIWNGTEDNEILSQIIAGGVIEPDEIYSKLDEIYKKLS